MTTPPPTTPDPPASPEETAALGQRLLETGRSKEAVALLRPWRNAHPGEPWDGLLARAYLGRGRELAAEGFYKEALLLWDDAARLTAEPPDQVERLPWLFNAHQYGEATALFVTLEKRLRRERPRLYAAARTLIAALLLGEFSEVREALPTRSPLHGQKETAAAALRAVCENEPDARERIEALSTRSPYRDLRWILTALTLPGSEQKEMQRALKKVPPASPFADLAGLARTRLVRGPELVRHLLALPSGLRPLAARLAGVSPDRLELLEKLAKNPDGSDLLHQLLEPVSRWMDAEFEPLARQCCLDLLPDHPNSQERFTARFGPLPAFEKNRLAALDQEARRNVPTARAYWLKCLQVLKKEKPAPETVMKTAQIHLRIAQLERHSHRPDPRIIRSHLESCLKHDPDEREALAWLIELLGGSGERSLRQTWINHALERHPKDTALLTLALEAAESGGAYKRAASLARRILRLDPGNDAVRGMRIEAHLAHARKRILGDRPDLALAELDKASRAEWHGPPNPVIPILQALTARLTGDRDAETAALKRARALSENDGIHHLRLLLECHRLKLEETRPELPEEYLHGLNGWSQTLPDTIGPIMAIGHFFLDHLAGEKEWVARMLTHLEGYLLLGADLPFTSARCHHMCRLFQETGQHKLQLAYGEAMEDLFPGADDPRFLFHRLHGRSRGRITHVPKKDLPLLREAARSAREGGFAECAAMIERFVSPRSDIPDLPPGLDAPSLLSKSQTNRLIRELSRQLREDYDDIRPTLGDKGLKELLLKRLAETEFAAYGPFVLAHLIDRALARTHPEAQDADNGRTPPPQQLELDLFP